jgi:hypothetical protein
VEYDAALAGPVPSIVVAGVISDGCSTGGEQFTVDGDSF